MTDSDMVYVIFSTPITGTTFTSVTNAISDTTLATVATVATALFTSILIYSSFRPLRTCLFLFMTRVCLLGKGNGEKSANASAHKIIKLSLFGKLKN